MKIYSEKTGKEYATVDECIAAEQEYDEKVAAEKVEKEKVAAERKERAAEVEAAAQKVIEAKKEYQKVLDAFLKDYGNYHLTIRGADKNLFGLFDNILDKFWF